MKALFHVQHLLGTGHFVRAAAIGHALAARGVAVTIVAGNTPPATTATDGLEVVALPPIRARDATFRPLLGPEGTPATAAVWAERRERLLGLLERVSPDLVVLETFPFGRKPFAGEIEALIGRARAMRRPPLIASSIRDILVRKDDPHAERRMAERALAALDLVLVHADPAVVRLSDSFRFAGRVEHLLAYTGYVHAPSGAAAPPGAGDGEVIVSSGGGRHGHGLFEAAIAARALSRRLSAAPFRLLVSDAHGSGLRAALERLAAAAAPDGAVRVEGTRPDFRALLEQARLSITRCGYNTALDVLAAGRPAVFVPYVAWRETEQRQRAEILAAAGLAATCDPDALDPAALAEAAEAALDLPPRRHSVDVGGAARSAEILIEAAARRVAGRDPIDLPKAPQREKTG